tara:strand:- start:276 stop:437 length:162 start_codon:yes stop_codon:yes gene_type:complete
MIRLSFVSPDEEKSPRVKAIEPSANTTIIKVGHAAGIEIPPLAVNGEGVGLVG